MLQLLYHSFTTNLSLLTCLLPCRAAHVRAAKSRVHDVEELLNIWHGYKAFNRLEQSAVYCAIDGERVFAPAYWRKADILSSDNAN